MCCSLTSFLFGHSSMLAVRAISCSRHAESTLSQITLPLLKVLASRSVIVLEGISEFREITRHVHSCNGLVTGNVLK